MKGVNINAFNQEAAKRNLTETAKKMLIKNQKLDISVLAKESGMTSWEDIAKKSLEMQVTSEEAAVAQDIEDRNVKKEGELQINNE